MATTQSPPAPPAPPVKSPAPPPASTFINEATWDRLLRIALGIALLYLGWSGAVPGTLGTVIKYLGFLPLVTGLAGWCPAYRLLGVSTCKS
ncbi:MAG TPA: DUF2892 domain-containing protein [Gemmatimonadales bacterium]|nr:DUF2892 domain-containing protein [Gemmatimonadales bacterium]